MERLGLEKFNDKKLETTFHITGKGFHTGWLSKDTLQEGTDVCCDEDGDGKISSGDTVEFSDGIITVVQ